MVPEPVVQASSLAGHGEGGEPQDMTSCAQHDAVDRQPQQSLSPENHAEQASKLDQENPRWIVLWGIFSHQYVAFPLFLVPPGTVLCFRSEPELLRRMRQTETIYGRERNDE